MRVWERVNAICVVYPSMQLMCRWPLKTDRAKRRLEFLPLKSAFRAEQCEKSKPISSDGDCESWVL